jgi:hypothetical protein
MEAAMRRKSKQAVISLAVALAMVSVFSLRAFAAPGAMDAAKPVGVLVSQGEVMINGAEVATGATVLNGSEVRTGLRGIAEVELGELGRVRIEPGTGVRLEERNKQLRVEPLAEVVRVKLVEGKAELSTSAGKEVMSAGEVREVSGLKEVVAGERVALTIASVQDKQDQQQGQKDQTQAGGGGGNKALWIILAIAGATTLGFLIHHFTQGEEAVSPSRP